MHSFYNTFYKKHLKYSALFLDVLKWTLISLKPFIIVRPVRVTPICNLHLLFTWNRLLTSSLNAFMQGNILQSKVYILSSFQMVNDIIWNKAKWFTLVKGILYTDGKLLISLVYSNWYGYMNTYKNVKLKYLNIL